VKEETLLGGKLIQIHRLITDGRLEKSEEAEGEAEKIRPRTSQTEEKINQPDFHQAGAGFLERARNQGDQGFNFLRYKQLIYRAQAPSHVGNGEVEEYMGLGGEVLRKGRKAKTVKRRKATSKSVSSSGETGGGCASREGGSRETSNP